MTDGFTPKLGRIGWKNGTRLDHYINKVMHAAQAAGHVGNGGRKGFSGAHIGRGGAFGTLAGAGLYPGGQRRAIVKARITKLRRGDLGAARAHLRYIQRDGVTPEGEAGQLYSRDTDEANGIEFLDRCEDDRHQFRLIVSADDGAELSDLKPFIRDLMTRAEADLGTKLDWVAVDHFNTGHPHTHIVIRGKDDRGEDLVIARDYMSHGFRMRARELVTIELGPEIESDMTLNLAREVETERFTRLDRSLLRHADRGFLVVSTMPPTDHHNHAAHMGRLRKLEDLGLAEERQKGVWEIPGDADTRLKALGSRGDIIKTMHRSLRETGVDRPAGSFVVFDTSNPNARVAGRVAGLGLKDEINDRHYLVIDGLDGKVHYADVGHLSPEFVPERGMIITVENRSSGEGERARTRVRNLSYLNLEKLIEAEGATWLDKELLNAKPERLVEAGFGAEVGNALSRRRQWLVSKSLGRTLDGGQFQPSPNLLEQLRIRDIRQAGAILSRELGLAQAEPVEAERISGTYVRSVDRPSGRYAILAKSKEFYLVPWQPEMEKFKSKPLSGTSNGRGVSWEWTGRRETGLGIS